MKTKLMTKLALAAAVVCAAVGEAQAKGVSWLFSDVSSSTADGRDGNALTGKKQYTAYLYVESGARDINSRENYTTLESIVNLLNTKSTTFSDSAYSTSSGAGHDYNSTANTASWGVTVQLGTVYDTIKAFAIVLDSTSIATAKNYMIVKNSNDNNSIYGTYTAGATSSDNGTLRWGSQSGNSWVAIGTIPEPTSGVLLLVGVAALALRRKRVA